jgi:hypothetical protein
MRPVGAVRLLVAGAVAVALQLGATSARPADESYTRLIRYSGDKLTVHVTGVPIDDILGEIERQAGAEIRGGVRNPHPVTAEFEDVPLADALHRLLGDQNFALIYGRGGELKTLRLLGGPQTAPPSVVAATPTAQPQPGAVSPAVLADMFARHAPIPIKGRLAQALGTDNASFTQVADAALHNEDAAVRTEAVRTAMQALEGEPELRSAVVSAVTGIGDPELGNIVRGLAGERAEEIVRHVLTTARASELRIKASGVLQQLRTNPVAANGS